MAQTSGLVSLPSWASIRCRQLPPTRSPPGLSLLFLPAVLVPCLANDDTVFRILAVPLRFHMCKGNGGKLKNWKTLEKNLRRGSREPKKESQFSQKKTDIQDVCKKWRPPSPLNDGVSRTPNAAPAAAERMGWQFRCKWREARSPPHKPRGVRLP